jgi:hypothetical protein
MSTKIGAQTDRQTERQTGVFLRVRQALQTRQKGSYPVVS